MKNLKLYCLAFSLSLFFLTSCGQIFNAVVVPSQCKKCELIDLNTGRVVWSDEGCGGGITNLNKNCKVQAYERSRSGVGSLCNLECNCETWKKPETE